MESRSSAKSAPARVAVPDAIPDAKSSEARFSTLTLSARLPESLFPITSRDDLARKFRKLFAPDVHDSGADSSLASAVGLPPRKKPDSTT
jgi:hypothetical protein